VAEVIDDTYTDGFLVMHRGQVVTELYPGGMPADRPHILMSVSKSVVGCLAAALVDNDLLHTDRPVTDYIPELATSGYAGATVRDVLDMRSGVHFEENYLNPHSDVHLLGESPDGVYAYLTGLVAEAQHGTRFLYRSAETDVLGWVCERAGGQPIAELISTFIWQPIGAGFDAEMLCDPIGTGYHDGGLCATARDMARFGQMLLDGGAVPDGSDDDMRSVIGARWLRDSWAVDADARTVFAASPSELSMRGGWYRNQFWFRPGPYGDVLLCLGIHGQMVHISRRTHTVCVKFSTWPNAQSPLYFQDTLRAFDNLGGALSRRPRHDGPHRLQGVVAGAHRHGATDRSPESDE
jgi:CubicO group peptidase (beta-lactamase class C family)